MQKKRKTALMGYPDPAEFMIYAGEFVLIVVMMYTLDVMALRNGTFNVLWAVMVSLVITGISRLWQFASERHI